MQRVMVIGCPGGGKSTFSRGLHEKTGLPLYHLDMIYWNADKTTVPKPVFRERLQNILARDSWIVDGNYGSTIELRLQACDTVFFLDFPTELCLDGVRERRGRPRTDMPWIETEDGADDEEFISFIRDFNTFSRPKIIGMLEAYPDRDIIVFKTREEADEYLAMM